MRTCTPGSGSISRISTARTRPLGPTRSAAIWLQPPGAAPRMPPGRGNPPFGKVPAIEDQGTAMSESGAILEYVLERYGNGRLVPRRDSALWAPFLQWVHFADSTAFAGLGNIAWHTQFKQDAEKVPEAISDYRVWAEAALDLLESVLVGRDFILGAEFSGADIMLGYTLLVAKSFGVLSSAAHPKADAYLDRLTARPALRKALQAGLAAA